MDVTRVECLFNQSLDRFQSVLRIRARDSVLFGPLDPQNPGSVMGKIPDPVSGTFITIFSP